MLVSYEKVPKVKAHGDGRAGPNPTVSLAGKTLAKTRAAEVVSDTFNAHELNKDLTRRFKRMTRDLEIEVENIKKSRTDRPRFKMATMQDNHLLNRSGVT